MAGYSYFNYDQMTLLEVEVHSDELELLKQAADEYDWDTITSEVEHKFKEAALEFRNKKVQSVCPLCLRSKPVLINSRQRRIPTFSDVPF